VDRNVNVVLALYSAEMVVEVVRYDLEFRRLGDDVKPESISALNVIGGFVHPGRYWRMRQMGVQLSQGDGEFDESSRLCAKEILEGF
jgi:hypothetical protein